jgi:methylenetetrahydrofolate dehydrogenase (NADP+) / methenyltetrahydrofolate cyclohydrolase
MYTTIDGKNTATEIKSEIAKEVRELIKNGGKQPHLAAILVGNDGASETYVNHKVKDCHEVGFKSTLLRYEDTISETFLLDKIKAVNNDADIDGLIVQLPLPKHISEQKVIETIDPRKDVDGFHPVNVGRMVLGMPAFVSATPAGILELLKRYHIETSGKNCVVVGRSNIVGKPVSILMGLKSNPGDATVTLCHSRTKNLADVTRNADIVIAALGNPGFLKSDMIREGAVVIDVGTTRVPDSTKKSGWSLKGDVDFEQTALKSSAITPVPGGVGPMTRVMLLKNTLLSAKKVIYG